MPYPMIDLYSIEPVSGRRLMENINLVPDREVMNFGIPPIPIIWTATIGNNPVVTVNQIEHDPREEDVTIDHELLRRINNNIQTSPREICRRINDFMDEINA